MTKKNIEDVLVFLCKVTVVTIALLVSYAFVCGVMCL